MHLDDLLASPVALPSIPRVLAMLLSELNAVEPDLRRINQFISTDPELTTRLLRLANSAQFQFAKRIGSVSEALALMGLDQVRALSLTAAMVGVFKVIPGVDMQQYWRSSLDVGKLARTLARVAGTNPSVAFTAGLIHAAGELVLHLGMPDQMRWLDAQIGPLALKRAKAERKLLGYCYADVGAGFARHWQFPSAIVDAIEYQWMPFEDQVYEPLCGIVHLSSWRVRARLENLGQQALIDGFPDVVALHLGIDIDDVLQQDPIDWTSPQESASLL